MTEGHDIGSWGPILGMVMSVWWSTFLKNLALFLRRLEAFSSKENKYNEFG